MTEADISGFVQVPLSIFNQQITELKLVGVDWHFAIYLTLAAHSTSWSCPSGHRSVRTTRDPTKVPKLIRDQ